MPAEITVNGARAAVTRRTRPASTDLTAIGEPALWAMGGTLALAMLMIAGLLLLVLWNGFVTFVPKPIEVVTLAGGDKVAGEPVRSEAYRPGPEILQSLSEDRRRAVVAREGFAARTLYRVGNYDIYNDDFRWIPDYAVASIERPADLLLVERLEWGAFIGRITTVTLDGTERPRNDLGDREFEAAHAAARQRWQRIRRIERSEIGAINHEIEQQRLALKRVALRAGVGSPAYREAALDFERLSADLNKRYGALAAEAKALKDLDDRDRVTLAEIGGKEKTILLSSVIRQYRANELSPLGAVSVYLSRWIEYLADEPREANTEGGVMPAIFGTLAMTVLLVLAVTPFGVITALYLREYAKQGRLVAAVRISVNNLAGVPSIVYGVFGLGFFAYVLGGTIDEIFYPERLPAPTFGTGGLLWASLTLALMTVPVVIVATEEALAAVPRSMREGSLACGASKWQTIRSIVLPRAMPGIMTGVILAMARGAGEVAPLMLVGVVKLAPELPIDGFFPFLHLERSFMHLGFHIFDVGFQSRNSEAGKPMVFVTTLLLIVLIAVMNAAAIVIRNRLKRKFQGSQF
jgi:phosphate transport system permease protein